MAELRQNPAVVEAYYKDYLADFPSLLTAGWGFTVETATQGIRLILSGLFDACPHLNSKPLLSGGLSWSSRRTTRESRLPIRYGASASSTTPRLCLESLSSPTTAAMTLHNVPAARGLRRNDGAPHMVEGYRNDPVPPWRQTDAGADHK